jgi:hypothetical protein
VCDIKADKEKAAEKIEDNIPPKPLGFLRALYKTGVVAVRLARFSSERGSYHHQQQDDPGKQEEPTIQWKSHELFL